MGSDGDDRADGLAVAGPVAPGAAGSGIDGGTSGQGGTAVAGAVVPGAGGTGTVERSDIGRGWARHRS